MSDKTLGYLLSKTKPGKNKAASKLLLLKDHPYSQPLLALKGKGDFTNKNIQFKYDWYQSQGSHVYSELDDVLNIGIVKLSSKKKKKKKKLKKIVKQSADTDSLTTLSDLKEVLTDQDSPSITKDESDGQIAKKKNKKPKKKRKKKPQKINNPDSDDFSDIDDYTSWINLISGIDSFEYAYSGKKKRKKKKKKAKSLLLKKIDQSNKVKDKIVSEQLAELYVEQGHLDKAIHMYEKLSLKNTEKSAFFAPLIEELKKKQQ